MLDLGQERLARRARERGLPVHEVARVIGVSESEIREAWSSLTGKETGVVKPVPVPVDVPAGARDGSYSPWAPVVVALPCRVNALAILRIVARYYMMSEREMTYAGKARHVVRARQIAFYLCRELTDMSFLAIGRRFGNRDHSTILHGDQSIRRLLSSNAKIRADVNAILTVIHLHYATHATAVHLHPNAGEDI